MSGYAKRRYHQEMVELQKKIFREIRKMQVVLPLHFDINDVVKSYKKYYPFSFFEWEDMNQTYIQKNQFLLSIGKKKRYDEFASFEEFLLSINGMSLFLAKSKKGEFTTCAPNESGSYIQKRNAKIHQRENAILLCKSNRSF